MKLLLLPLLSGICLAPLNNTVNSAGKASVLQTTVQGNIVAGLTFQDVPGYGKMACVAFKAQDYCRAELEDFDFDAHFTVVSATVYFSGANFNNVEKGFITSNSLKSIRPLMNRCLPGSRVVFDDIKVKGPDNSTRTIQGINLLLF